MWKPLSLTGCVKDKRGDMTFAELEEAFKTVPDSTKIGVDWYWIANNISAEGVVKDLQSMKKAGINRAFIGNIGLTEVAECVWNLQAVYKFKCLLCVFGGKEVRIEKRNISPYKCY